MRIGSGRFDKPDIVLEDTTNKLFVSGVLAQGLLVLEEKISYCPLTWE